MRQLRRTGFCYGQGKLVMQGNPKEVFSHVEKLKSLGLEVPQVTELAYMLKRVVLI